MNANDFSKVFLRKLLELATLTNYLDDKVTEQLDPFQLFKAHLQKSNCFYVFKSYVVFYASSRLLVKYFVLPEKLIEVGINTF